jgi:hypothetical protein
MSIIDDRATELTDGGFDLGAPIDVEQSDANGRAWKQYEHAWLLYDATVVWILWGTVFDAYNRLGGLETHGFPTATQEPVEGFPDTFTWDFDSGTRIYEVTGDPGFAFVVPQPILGAYLARGGPSSDLGRPAADERFESGVWFVEFESAAAMYTDGPTVTTLSPRVNRSFWEHGGPGGELGRPIEDSSVGDDSEEVGRFAQGTLRVGVDGSASIALSGSAGPPVTHIPARAMTHEAAWSEVVALHRAGSLTLADNAPPADGPVPATRTQVRLVPESIHGVEFRYWDGKKTMRHVMQALDVRNVVALARLARWLKDTYGVTVVYHIGISGGDGRTDCHGMGRALDFAGVQGAVDGVAFDWQVFRDWGMQSVPDLAHPGGVRLRAWPAGTRDLEYRLTSHPTADSSITAFFPALYDFCADEWQDLDDRPSPVGAHSVIGHRSFMMQPDHPASDVSGKSGREAHINHLHLQIGTTR